MATVEWRNGPQGLRNDDYDDLRKVTERVFVAEIPTKCCHYQRRRQWGPAPWIKSAPPQPEG